MTRITQPSSQHVFFCWMTLQKILANTHGGWKYEGWIFNSKELTPFLLKIIEVQCVHWEMCQMKPKQQSSWFWFSTEACFQQEVYKWLNLTRLNFEHADLFLLIPCGFKGVWNVYPKDLGKVTGKGCNLFPAYCFNESMDKTTMQAEEARQMVERWKASCGLACDQLQYWGKRGISLGVCSTLTRMQSSPPGIVTCFRIVFSRARPSQTPLLGWGAWAT